MLQWRTDEVLPAAMYGTLSAFGQEISRRLISAELDDSQSLSDASKQVGTPHSRATGLLEDQRHVAPRWKGSKWFKYVQMVVSMCIYIIVYIYI